MSDFSTSALWILFEEDMVDGVFSAPVVRRVEINSDSEVVGFIVGYDDEDVDGVVGVHLPSGRIYIGELSENGEVNVTTDKILYDSELWTGIEEYTGFLQYQVNYEPKSLPIKEVLF